MEGKKSTNAYPYHTSCKLKEMGSVEDTCNKEPSICAHTKYRKIRLQRDNLSLGDWQETYHRRSVSSSVQGNKPKVRQRVMDSPLASVVPLSLLFYPLSPRYISRKETCSPWQRVNSATAPASVLQQEPVSSFRFFYLDFVFFSGTFVPCGSLTWLSSSS